MNFNDNLNKLINNKNIFLNQSESLNKEQQNEIAKEQAIIMEKYSSKISENKKRLKDCYFEIDEYCKTIEKYSSFDEADIAYIITSIIRTIECLPYKYELAIASHDIMVYENYNRIHKKAYENLRLIVKDNVNYSYPVRKNVIDDLLLSNEAILLANFTDEEILNFKSSKNKIQFYKFDDSTHTINSIVKYGKFDYIKEFIDGVITYKIDNDIIDISREDLNVICFDFIKSKISLASKNRALIENQYENDLNKKLNSYKEYQYYIKTL